MNGFQPPWSTLFYMIWSLSISQVWPKFHPIWSFKDTVKVGTRKAYPHLLYSKIWRWNQIKTHSDIIGVCHYGFAKVVVFKFEKISYLDLLVENARIWLALLCSLKTHLSNCNTFVSIHFTIFSKEKFCSNMAHIII